MALQDVLNAHHAKLDEHTIAVKDLQAKVDASDAKIATLEAQVQELRDFMQPIIDWANQIKEMV